MRRFAQFFLISCFLAIPGIAQRGGGGFHGGGGGGFTWRNGVVSAAEWVVFTAGALLAQDFAEVGLEDTVAATIRGTWLGFGFPGYWPYYGAGWGYPYYGYPYYYPYAAYPYAAPYPYPYYGYRYAYSGPDQAYCPQANGKPLYLIKLTYDNQVWMSQEYWYTADTLNFITLRGEQNKTPISSIDHAATFRLNGMWLEFPV